MVFILQVWWVNNRLSYLSQFRWGIPNSRTVKASIRRSQRPVSAVVQPHLQCNLTFGQTSCFDVNQWSWSSSWWSSFGPQRNSRPIWQTVSPHPKFQEYILIVAYRYRMRLISMSCDPNYEFSIDDHAMTIIEADGEYTKPLTVDTIKIYAGVSRQLILMLNLCLNVNLYSSTLLLHCESSLWSIISSS